MKYYAPKGFGTHTIKVMFQHEQYKGYITFEMGGNCKGLDIVKQDADTILDSIDNAKFTDMDIALVDDCSYEGTICLTDDNCNDMEIDFCSEVEFEELIVGIEIVDFKPDDEERNEHI